MIPTLHNILPAAETDRPNMLVILADDLGYGDLACRGARDMRTPNLDRVFAQGMEFTNFYANCPVCSPTRAALLSGRYQELVGVPGVIRTHPNNNWGYLNPTATMLPKVAQDNGYHTALVGKWHLGLESPNTPIERGFDHLHGFLGDMMDDYYNHRRHGNNYMYHDRTEIDPQGHATDLFSQWSIDYLNSRK
ncbi:MAG: sulfatase-like hydrolase/transferase, partial [Fuerstiella sp.]